MSLKDIYEAAGLTQPEIDVVESYIEQDSDGEFCETSAFERLLDHFCNTQEIPYAIVSQNLWSPENTGAPDDWIIEHLKSV